MNFITVHSKGKEALINVDWIEMVVEEDDGSCTIYFSFNLPNADEQDYTKPEESYLDIKRKILRADMREEK